jgi:hypothetical protein
LFFHTEFFLKRFLFLVVLEFELRASHLLVRHCTTWALTAIYLYFLAVVRFELRTLHLLGTLLLEIWLQPHMQKFLRIIVLSSGSFIKMFCNVSVKNLDLTCWHTPVTLALGRLRQEDHDFEVRLGYIWRTRSQKIFFGKNVHLCHYI